MNKIRLILAAIAFIALFVSCNHHDTTAPVIYFLDTNGNVSRKADTTIMLYTTYVDPGCYVEDNASLEANIQLESDIETVLTISKKDPHKGQVSRATAYDVTYTATDEAGNVATKVKTINCKNVTSFLGGSYLTNRTGGGGAFPDTSYFSNISASASKAGTLRFSKVCSHVINGKKVYFRVDADLCKGTESQGSYSEQIGFMGTPEDKEVPYYAGMTYEKAIDSAKCFEYIYIWPGTYPCYNEADSTQIAEFRVQGNSEGGKPKSKIEYYEGSNNVKRIVLDLNITKDGRAYTIQEEYIPEY